MATKPGTEIAELLPLLLATVPPVDEALGVIEPLDDVLALSTLGVSLIFEATLLADDLALALLAVFNVFLGIV
jgi:hypothetical protein